MGVGNGRAGDPVFASCFEHLLLPNALILAPTAGPRFKLRDCTRRRLILADLGGSEKLTRSNVAADFKAPVVTIGNEEVRNTGG